MFKWFKSKRSRNEETKETAQKHIEGMTTLGKRELFRTLKRRHGAKGIHHLDDQLFDFEEMIYLLLVLDSVFIEE